VEAEKRKEGRIAQLKFLAREKARNRLNGTKNLVVLLVY